MQELITNLAPNLASKLPDFYKALGDTLLMVLWSGAISFVLGLALGVLLIMTKPGGILENKVLYQIVDKLVSLFRSIPFIILLTWVMPITRALVGEDDIERDVEQLRHGGDDRLVHVALDVGQADDQLAGLKARHGGILGDELLDLL